jgi:hypothetical protein
MNTLIPLIYPNGYDIITIFTTFFVYTESKNYLFTSLLLALLYVCTRIGYCAGCGVRHVLLTQFYVSNSPANNIIGFLMFKYGFQCIGIILIHYEILSILGVIK